MATKRVLVYGGKGSLGSYCVSAFKARKWWVGSIASSAHEQADANITVNYDTAPADQEKHILDQLHTVLKGDRVDAIICVAGGWAGGNASAKDFTKTCDLLCKQSIVSSVIATSIATKLLKEGGLLSLSGARAALEPTPGMIGYGLAKAAVHHLTKSLASPSSGLPAKSTVVCILPGMIDTSTGSKAESNTSTPLDYISDLIIKWIEHEERPPSGSLVKLMTRGNASHTEIV